MSTPQGERPFLSRLDEVSLSYALNRLAGGFSDPHGSAQLALVMLRNPLQERDDTLIAHEAERMHRCMANMSIGVCGPRQQQIDCGGACALSQSI